MRKSVGCVSKIDDSKASIAVFLPAVCFGESSNCCALPTLRPIKTSPPNPATIPTIVRTGMTVFSPSTMPIRTAALAKVYARPGMTSLRLRHRPPQLVDLRLKWLNLLVSSDSLRTLRPHAALRVKSIGNSRRPARKTASPREADSNSELE